MADRAQIAELLWGARQRPPVGRKPSLSLDRIVEAAIAVADAEGLAAVSMQRVAEDLGFTKMSLYRYTPGKAELTTLMLDAAYGPAPDLANVSGDWRPKLHAWSMHMRIAMLRHPWGLELALGPRVLGPNELGWLEAGLAALIDCGLTGGERLDTIVILGGHLRSSVQQENRSGSVEQEMNAAMIEILTEHGDDYPQVRAAFAEAASTGEQDKGLEYGLDRILDGIATLIAERTRSGD